ncbi:ATP-binding protein, partial [Streptomyces sp. NPDC127079]
GDQRGDDVPALLRRGGVQNDQWGEQAPGGGGGGALRDRSDEVPVVERAVDERQRWRVGGRGWPIVCRLARDVEVAGLPSGGKRISAVVPLA